MASASNESIHWVFFQVFINKYNKCVWAISGNLSNLNRNPNDPDLTINWWAAISVYGNLKFTKNKPVAKKTKDFWRRLAVLELNRKRYVVSSYLIEYSNIHCAVTLWYCTWNLSLHLHILKDQTEHFTIISILSFSLIYSFIFFCCFIP